MKIILTIIILFLASYFYAQESRLMFDVNQNYWSKNTSAKSGRLFLIFNKESTVAVFGGIPYPDLKMNPVFATDVADWKTSKSLCIEENELYGFPKRKLAELQTGSWYVHALFKAYNSPLFLADEEQIYSEPVLITLDKKTTQKRYQITLTKKVGNVSFPVNSEHFLYESLSSPLLTKFWERPMATKFQVVLPSTFYTEPEREYPLLIMIGGFGERYYNKVIGRNELFDSNAPQMVIVLLDSKAPFGDSYQINSANNGPYGDVLIEEIIPYIESKYRCVGDSTSRFLTGTSTGGWSSLALQIFYPNFFNGTWSTCSDPVDFRQMELINIYEDENAFVNRHGLERPAMRDINGEPRYTLRTEVWGENVLGIDNSYHLSGGQWGSWNALFSPKDSITGLPKMIFDAETGKIDKEVAKAWKKYDLRLYLSENWNDIGHKLQGKLHIWMGTMDSYYLNNAMVLFDDFLKTTTHPKSDAKINFICGEGHACDSNIPLSEMMKQMLERYEKSN
jgi:hypothetical protein